ncbi:MAG: hypothetical protein MUE69_19300 [Myxococcota bacterium]|jgi:hypothetical protein|nr:hypothetical protein [Myxococcota bacterium]
MIGARSFGVWIVLGVSLVLGGCAFEPIDASNRMPPCARGFVEVGERCVREGSDAGFDAGSDAGRDASVDAGAEDAGLDGAGPDAPEDSGVNSLSECTSEGRLGSSAFCDGFENPGFNWGRQVGFGSVGPVRATDGVEPYRGLFMLRARITNPASWAQGLVCPFRPGGRCPADDVVPDDDEVVASGDLHFRSYVYVPSDSPIDHVSLMHAGAHRGFDPLDAPASFNLDAAGSFMYVGASLMRYPATSNPEYRFPRDEWVCVRTHVIVGDVGEARSWVEHGENVDLVTEATDIDTLPDAPYLHFGLGLAWTSAAQEPTTVYFDEVAVSREPIPCDPR